MPSRPGNNPAAHRASQVIRQSGSVARQPAVMPPLRSRLLITVPVAPAEEDQPQVTSMNLEVTKTYTVVEGQVAEDMIQYELRDSDGKVLDRGMGDNLADALLGFAIRLENGEDPDLPNN